MTPSRKRGGVPPATRDLFAIAVILVIVDALAALLLVNSYLPRRRREAMAKAPAQLSVLARDRQNALTGWVRERISDAELTASLLAAANDDRPATEVLDRFLRAYGYTSAFLIDDSGAVLLRRGSAETDDATAVQFARETMQAAGTKVDFRRVGRIPRIFAATIFRHPGDGRTRVVLYVSDPYAYVYPLFSTTSVASKSTETNLIGLYDGWGVALNPYPSGVPPPLTSRRPIPKEYAERVLAVGEQAIRYNDRHGNPVIGVVKAIPGTPWVVIAKIDDAEVLAGAVAETWRLGRLLAVVSLLLALTAFVLLRTRRVRDLRVAQDQLARLFENSTTGIITFRVIPDGDEPTDHQIVDMNPAAEQLLGVSAASEIGKRSADAAYLQWPEAERENNYRVALRGASIQYDAFNAALGRWYETRSFSPRRGQFAHLFTDITERRKTEEAIRNLSARLLRVQDDERRRLARELHDTVGQNLAGLRMNLGVMKRFAASDERAADVIDESITTTDDAISQIRTMSYLLHPPMIDQAGLVTAIRWYVDGFERRSGIVTKLDVPDDLGGLSRDVETSAFRIIQESLTNIQRHAGSATASVAMGRLDGHLFIEVADDGRGLPARVRDDRDALLASGVGIAGINERVRELGGEVTIRSDDEGTTLRVTLPAR